MKQSVFKSRVARAAILLAVAAILLAACGSSSSSTATNSGSSSSTSGKTLTLQFTEPVSLNPALEGTYQSDIDFGALAYDSLIFQLPDGSYIPDLATKWGYVAGSGNKKFNLTIRSGVHFSDGSVMTPASVVASLNYFKKANGPQASYLASLTSATVTGTNTVQLSFSKPQPDLPFLLSQYEDVGQIIGPKGIADPKILSTTTDGTGPYMLSSSETVPNNKYVYIKNPYYWNPSTVHFDKVVVKVISDPQSALSALESGQVDALTEVPPTITAAAKSAGYKVYSAPFSLATMILMDRGGSISPLGKLAVRQAINYAIDRNSLAKALGGPNAVPTDQLALKGATGYDPALANTYAYNLSKAKSLMASAGESKGFSMSVLDTAALDPNGQLGAALKTELAAIGITVNLTVVPSPAQFIPAALTKKYAAVIWPFAQAGYGFPYAVEFAMTPFTNVFNTTSTTLDRLMATAGAETTQSEQNTEYQKVNAFLVNNAWFVPVYSLDAVFVIGKTITNVTPPTVLNTTMDPVVPKAGLSWKPAS
jgi:peptide/nickel transport system substrate-binding protein